MNNEIKLTLDPTAGISSAAAAAEAPAAQSQPEPSIPNPTAQAPAIDESMFSEAERRAIEEFSKQIDIRNSGLILGYGSAAQKKISDFSDTALGSVRNKDFGETGTMITNLIGNLRSMN